MGRVLNVFFILTTLCKVIYGNSMLKLTIYIFFYLANNITLKNDKKKIPRDESWSVWDCVVENFKNNIKWSLRDEDLNEITASIINRMALCSFRFYISIFFSLHFQQVYGDYLVFQNSMSIRGRKAEGVSFILNKELSGKKVSPRRVIFGRDLQHSPSLVTCRRTFYSTLPKSAEAETNYKHYNLLSWTRIRVEHMVNQCCKRKIKFLLYFYIWRRRVTFSYICNDRTHLI